MKRDRNVAAGFLLSLAALVRIYPAFLLAGLALAVAGRSLAARRPVLSPSQKGLLLGGLLGAAVLLPLSHLLLLGRSRGLCAALDAGSGDRGRALRPFRRGLGHRRPLPLLRRDLCLAESRGSALRIVRNDLGMAQPGSGPADGVGVEHGLSQRRGDPCPQKRAGPGWALARIQVLDGRRADH